MKRIAQAVWQGKLMGGRGHLTTASKTLAEAPYSFPTRFEDKPGTNPEELIAAAHAGCFSMALAFQLESVGLTPESLRTKAELSLEKGPAGWTIPEIHLDVTARVPGAADAAFQKVAEQAKAGCLISRLLNTKITLLARLEA